MKGKIIQIAGSIECLYALTDQGEVWEKRHGYNWNEVKLPEAPETPSVSQRPVIDTVKKNEEARKKYGLG